MDSSQNSRTEIEETKARRAIYQVLSSSFYPPNKNIDNIAKLWDVLSPFYFDGENKPERAESVVLDPAALELEYNRLFVGPNKLPCPPYESTNRKDRAEMELGMVLGPSVIDVKERYADACLDISNDFTDLPDHIAVELEFMTYLCTKELSSKGTSEEELWHERQRKFVLLHLKPWVSSFAEKVVKSTSFAFYKAAGLSLNEFINEEIESFEDN